VDILCKRAHCFILSLPKMHDNSIIASTSSAELKKGNRFVRKLSNITPHDQISISKISETSIGGYLWIGSDI